MAELLLQLTGSRRLSSAAHRAEVAAARGCAALLLWWERGRQRRALGRLDDQLLRDIGRSREEAARECAKPVWR